MSLFGTWIDSLRLYREIKQEVTQYKGRNTQSRGLAPITVYDTPTSSMSTSPGRSPRVLAQFGYVGNPVVYRAINVIADECSAIPLLVKTRGANGKVQENSQLNFMLKQPNLDKAKGAYIEQMVKYWLISGTTYTYLASGNTPRSFQPAALYQLRPDLMTVQADELNGVTGYRYETGKTRTDYTPAQVKPIHFFHPLDELYGLSPITVAAVIIDRQNEGEAWNASFMKHAARPSGAFVIPGMLGEEEYGRMRREIMTKYTGKNAAGSPLLLEGGLTYIQTGNNPLDADWNNSDANAGRKIAMAIGVDPLLLNDKEHSTYNNVTEARIALIDVTVHPMMSRVIDEWNMWLAPRFGGDLEISLDQQYLDRIHDDVSATSTRVQNEYTKGLLSWNTAQQLTGRTSQPWGEFYQMGPQTYVSGTNMQEYLDQQHTNRMSAGSALQGLPGIQGAQAIPGINEQSVPQGKLPAGKPTPLQLPAPKTPAVAKKGWEALQPTNALVEYAVHIKAIRDKWVTQFQGALQHHFETETDGAYLPELFLKYYANIAEDACYLHTANLQATATVYEKDTLSVLARYAALHLSEIEGITLQDPYLLAVKEVNTALNVGLYITAILLATGLQKTWVAFDGESVCQLHAKLHGASTGVSDVYPGTLLFPDKGECGCSCLYSLTTETKFNGRHDRGGRFAPANNAAMVAIAAGQGTLFPEAVGKIPAWVAQKPKSSEIVLASDIPTGKLHNAVLTHFDAGYEGDNPRYTTTVDGTKYFVKHMEGNMTGNDPQDMMSKNISANESFVVAGLARNSVPMTTFLHKDGEQYTVMPFAKGFKSTLNDGLGGPLAHISNSIASKFIGLEAILGTGDRHDGQYLYNPKAKGDLKLKLIDFDIGYPGHAGVGGTSALMDSFDSNNGRLDTNALRAVAKHGAKYQNIAADNGVYDDYVAQRAQAVNDYANAVDAGHIANSASDLANYLDNGGMAGSSHNGYTPSNMTNGSSTGGTGW